MTNRKTSATIAQAKKMTMNELAALLNIDELKENITKMMNDDNINDSVIDAMLEALELLMNEKEYGEFCDSL